MLVPRSGTAHFNCRPPSRRVPPRQPTTVPTRCCETMFPQANRIHLITATPVANATAYCRSARCGGPSVVTVVIPVLTGISSRFRAAAGASQLDMIFGSAAVRAKPGGSGAAAADGARPPGNRGPQKMVQDAPQVALRWHMQPRCVPRAHRGARREPSAPRMAGRPTRTHTRAPVAHALLRLTACCDCPSPLAARRDRILSQAAACATRGLFQLTTCRNSFPAVPVQPRSTDTDPGRVKRYRRDQACAFSYADRTLLGTRPRSFT